MGLRAGASRKQGYASRQCLGTSWRNHHPIVKLRLDKFASLARMEQDPPTAAFLAVSDLADDTPAEFEVRWRPHASLALL
jgi:hypothetical protein